MPDKKTGIEALSDRQREILLLISKGYQQKEVARFLGIEASTIRGHTEEARRKLGVTSSRVAARLLLNAHDHADISTLPPLRHDDGGPPEPVPVTPFIGQTSGHEQVDFIRHERTLHDNSQERSGEGYSDTDDTGETTKDFRNRERDFRGEGRGGRGGSDFSADLRTSGVSRYLVIADGLKKLNLIQWAGLTLCLTIVIIIATGGAVVGIMGIFQAITHLSGQTE